MNNEPFIETILYFMQIFIAGLPCKVSGTWTTTQAGVQVKITVVNHSLVVTLEKMNSAMKLHSGILNTTWNVTGHMPSKRGAPFALVATNIYIKSLATFVGTSIHEKSVRGELHSFS